jgi:hypothetical protein
VTDGSNTDKRGLEWRGCADVCVGERIPNTEWPKTVVMLPIGEVTGGSNVNKRGLDPILNRVCECRCLRETVGYRYRMAEDSIKLINCCL